MTTQTQTPIIKKELFGVDSRFCLDTMMTRFGALEYFVLDAEAPDKNGLSTVVFQTSDKAAAQDFINKQ